MYMELKYSGIKWTRITLMTQRYMQHSEMFPQEVRQNSSTIPLTQVLH